MVVIQILQTSGQEEVAERIGLCTVNEKGPSLPIMHVLIPKPYTRLHMHK